MIPLSAKDLLPFTPVEGGPTYQLAVPTMRQRAAYRRDVRAEGVRFVNDADLFELIRDGIRAVVETSAQGALLDTIDNYEPIMRDAEKLAADPGLYRDAVEIETTIERHYPPLAQALADRGEWMAVAPLVAFRHFVRGWEGLDVPYEARAGRVTEACLERIPENDIMAVGFRCIALMHPSQADAKNSESRSPSPSDRETSTAA